MNAQTMPNRREKPAGLITRNEVYSVVSDAEGDMREVCDHALILHDYMTRTGDLDAEFRGALSWHTGELVKLGTALREHFDAMHKAASA